MASHTGGPSRRLAVTSGRALPNPAPLWQLAPLPLGEIAIQGLLLALAGATWAMNAQRRWSHLAWLVILGALYANGRRNGWLVTIGSLTVLAANSRTLAPERLWPMICGRRRMGPDANDPQLPVPAAMRWVVRFGLVSWLVLQISGRAYALLLCDDPHLEADRPVGLVEFVKAHRLSGRMFNDLENSKYLAWHLAGQPPLFIDSHRAYPDQVTRDYLDIVQVSPRGRVWLEERGIDFVILTVNRPGPSLVPLAGFLDRGETWKRVYAEKDGVIWVRQSAENEQLWGNPHRVVESVSFATLTLYHRGGAGANSHFRPP